MMMVTVNFVVHDDDDDDGGGGGGGYCDIFPGTATCVGWPL
jgi:hypothetical protein